MPTDLALQELDEEEARITALLGRLADDASKARKQLEEVSVARKVILRIHGQPEQLAAGAISSAPDQDDQPGKPKIKEAALQALQAVYPKGFQKAGIEAWIEENLKVRYNSSSLSVMLARLRDDDRAVENHGNSWFYVPPKNRKAA